MGKTRRKFCGSGSRIFDENDEHHLIEIKREFLPDYLAARNLSLKLSHYRQRVENVISLENSEYLELEDHQEKRNNGRYELLNCSLNDVYGGSWAKFRTWRTDIDEEDDAPVMGPETNENTDYESSEGNNEVYSGVRVEVSSGEMNGLNTKVASTRVRGDIDTQTYLNL